MFPLSSQPIKGRVESTLVSLLLTINWLLIVDVVMIKQWLMASVELESESFPVLFTFTIHP